MKNINTKFETFMNESKKEVSYIENQRILRKYIKLLKTVESKNDFFEVKYFTIIHNFLYLESMYLDLVKQCNKELNKNLTLPGNATLSEIKSMFSELYDPYNNVRFSVETLDSIEEIDQIIKSTRSNKKIDLYDKILNKKQMKNLYELFK